MNRPRSRAQSLPLPPSSSENARGTLRSSNRKSHMQNRSPRRRVDVKLLLCIVHTTSHKWSTEPLRFDPNRINDRQLWSDIRYTFRTYLQKPWRRLLGVKKVKAIIPIYYTPNGVPVRKDPKDYPAAQMFMHAYHHPDEVRPDHTWVDFFVEFDASDRRTSGLEFVEGLWAEKLVILALIATVAIIAVSVTWCALGGNLQTVFTVMSFVLSLVAAQIALAALYYQVAFPN